ncbi:MAG: hypothetical protein ACR2N7_10045, partial [Acidimicrobiia bacterium]
VLSWRGPRFAQDYVFGNDIDAIGERSPVATVAAHIVRPWDRIFVITGDVSLDWHREDALLAFAVVERLRRSRVTPLVVVTPDRESAEGKIGDPDQVEFVEDEPDRVAIMERFEPNDLVVVPAHLLHDVRPVIGFRFARQLGDVSVAVVAGPHRLNVSKGVARPMQTVIHTGD